MRTSSHRGRLTAAAALLAASFACRGDAPSGVTDRAGGVRLALDVQLERSSADRTLQVRAFYTRTSGEQVPLTVDPSQITLPAGTSVRREIVVVVDPCLADSQRAGAPGPCRFSIELRLVDASGNIISQQTREAEASKPGETVSVPAFSLPAPGLRPSVTSLSFTAEERAAAPAAQTVTVASVSGAPLGTLTASVRYGPGATGWLNVSIAQATGTVTIQPSTNLPPSNPSYSATVTLSSSNPNIPPVDIPVTYVVTAIPTFPLAVTLAGTGSGSVTSAPAGITCATGAPTACTQSFQRGTSVTLTATPTGGGTFAGWSGACTGTGPCTVTLDQARAVTATFTGPPQTLSIALAGTGTASVTSRPAGITCAIAGGVSTGTCGGQFAFGTVVTLTATPTGGTTFIGWAGDCSGTDPCTVTLDQARNVTANFRGPPQTLSVGLAGTGTGSVVSSPPGINCGGGAGSACSATFPSGTTVTLTAAPDRESRFAGWSGACTGTGSCVVTVDQARAVTATFSRLPQRLTVALLGTGAGTVTSTPPGIACSLAVGAPSTTCTADFEFNTVVTLTASAATGSQFSGWSGACTGAGTCTVTLDQVRGVTATFTLVPILPPKPQVTVSVSSVGSGSGIITSSPGDINCAYQAPTTGGTCRLSVEQGTTVTLRATTVGNSIFSGWQGACAGQSANCTLVVDRDVATVAVFTLLPPPPAPGQVNVVGGGNGSGTVTSSPSGIQCTITNGFSTTGCNALFTPGTVVTLTATPAPGSVFEGFSGACTGAGPTCTVTADAAKSVTATFTKRTGPSNGTITVVGAGTGSGTVISSPAGIECTVTAGTTSGACTAPFPAGTPVTLTASPAAQSTFVGFSGACSSTTSCTVTADPTAPQTVTATFRGPPPPGRDVVVFNDLNPFDGTAMQNVNNQTMVRNLVTFTTTAARGSATTVWIDNGRNSTCNSGNRDCTPSQQEIFVSTMSQAGFTVTYVSSTAGSYATPIPAVVKVIYLFNPTVAFTRAEINTFKQFASEGGRIVFVGEHVGFYGQTGIHVENQFLRDLGAQMTNVGDQIDCGYVTLPASSLRPHQITTGMTNVTIACSSQMILGPNDFALYYDSSNSKVLSGVTRIDVTPLPARLPRAVAPSRSVRGASGPTPGARSAYATPDAEHDRRR